MAQRRWRSFKANRRGYWSLWFFLFLFIWIRWTIPRFRYDQLMNLGWKVLLPLAVLNLLLTAAGVVYFGY